MPPRTTNVPRALCRAIQLQGRKSMPFQKTIRLAAMTIVSILISAAAAPALATDGRTAVALCIDSSASGARCAWSVNDKGEIDICNKNGCVYCPSATAQCSVARSRPRPSRPLPVGTTVNTPIGSIEITKDPFTGSILRGRQCPDNLHPCLNRCLSRNEECILPR